MDRLFSQIERFNDFLGRTVSWLIAGMTGVTFAIVVLRYLFQRGWVWMQDLVIYAHAFVFLLASAQALQKNAHVRVDIFFQRFGPRGQAWINLLGALGLLLPSMGLIFYQSLPYVIDSWRVFEGSKDGGGLEAVFLLKSLILLFCLTTGLSGCAMAYRQITVLRGHRG